MAYPVFIKTDAVQLLLRMNTWVSPRTNLTENSLTVDALMATYWLNTEEQINTSKSNLEHLRQFAEERNLVISEAGLQEAADHLDVELAGRNVNGWVVFISFFGHPHNLWNFMLDAVLAAKNDEHLLKIAAGPAEHILAHYGSMVPYFEEQARRDRKFKRMLTGVWRHRMSDDVWMRLRAIQSDVPDPFSSMIPLDQGIAYMADSLSQADRENDDKGMYRRDAKGEWKKLARLK